MTTLPLLGPLATFGGANAEYRYNLRRLVDATGAWRALFIMLNPSTATEVDDDPTIRRCIGFARRWGCQVLEVANLFAYRATDPQELRRVMDPVGPCNDATILEAAGRADLIVAAWGNGGLYQGRGAGVMDLLRGCAVWRLGPATKQGQPRHPLYLRRDVALEPANDFALEQGARI